MPDVTRVLGVQPQKVGVFMPLTPLFVFLFFLSGATGLIYEMVWVRLFTVVFGNTTYGVSAVLTAFMAGLGMGSYVFGRLVDRKRNPLLIYAYLEVGIALSALAMPHILLLLEGLYSSIYNQYPTSIWLLQVIRTILSFLVLVVPTFLMGATLPVITKFLARRNIHAGRTIGLLYASNTLGATTGCLLTGLVLFKVFGLEMTTYISAALNFLLAGIFLVLNKFAAGAQDEDLSAIPVRAGKHAPAAPSREITALERNILLLCFALAGFTSLAYEVLWFRLLVFQMQTTVYAFTAMLTTFLAGIGLGSALFALIDRRQRGAAQYWAPFAYLEMAIGVLGLLSIVLLGSLDPLITHVSYTFWKFFGLLFASSFIIMLLPTILMGVAFPMVCRIYSQNVGRIGSVVGSVYAWNTVGAIFGAFITGFFLVRLLGTQKSLILISLCNFLIATIVLAFAPKVARSAAAHPGGLEKDEFSRGKLKRAWVLAGLWLLPVVIIVFIPGDFLFQYYNIGEKRHNERAEILYADEGVQGITTVHRYPEGYRVISTGSINVAGTSYTLRTTQILQGHIPMLLHPEAKQVLQVGFGSGETAHIVTQYANVEQHDTVEISQSVIDTSARFFQDINHDVVKNPKFHPIIMDGANYLRLTRKKYDVIMNDSIWPFYAGNSGLYTRGYFEAGRDHLNPGGIMTSWLPIDIAIDDFKVLLNTFHSVFPYVTVWMATTHDNKHALIAGSLERIEIDLERFLDRFQKFSAADLKEINLGDPVDFLDTFKMDEQGFGESFGSSAIHTEDKPILEFSISREQQDWAIYRTYELVQSLSTSFVPYLSSHSGRGREVLDKLAVANRASSHVMKGMVLKGKHNEAFYAEFETALKIWPQHPGARRFLIEAHSNVANILASKKNYAAAAEHYRAIISLKPDHEAAGKNLAYSYFYQGDYSRSWNQVHKMQGMKYAMQPDFLNALMARMPDPGPGAPLSQSGK